MRYFVNQNIIVDYTDTVETSMSGPEVGALSINGRAQEGRYLATKPLLSETGEFLFLGKDEWVNWKVGRFHVIALDLKDRRAFKSKESYSALFFVRAKRIVLTFYNALHDQLKEYLHEDEILDFQPVTFNFDFLDKNLTESSAIDINSLPQPEN